MLEQLNDLFIHFNEYAKQNQVVAGVISLWGLGTVTYLLKSVPIRIIGFFKRTFSTTLSINTHDGWVYSEFIKWLSNSKFKIYTRSLTADRFETSKNNNFLSPGYGGCFFMYRGRPVMMGRAIDTNNQTTQQKETITLRTIGRDHAFFDRMMGEVAHMTRKRNKHKFRVWNYGTSWNYKHKPPRPLNTVIIDKKTLDEIITHLDNFKKDKKWYKKHCIPYRTGVLLYGPPGTGKTSLAKAIASHYGKSLHCINLAKITANSAKEALAELPNGAIVLMEDIDTIKSTNARGKKKGKKKDKIRISDGDVLSSDADNTNMTADESTSLEDIMNFGMNLGDILNVLDGVDSSEDRIIIATTNHPDKLDAALIREGRFDVKVEIGYLNDETYRRFMKRFYPDLKVDKLRVKENMPPCKLQKLVVDNKSNPLPVLMETAVVESIEIDKDERFEKASQG